MVSECGASHIECCKGHPDRKASVSPCKRIGGWLAVCVAAALSVSDVCVVSSVSSSLKPRPLFAIFTAAARLSRRLCSALTNSRLHFHATVVLFLQISAVRWIFRAHHEIR